MIKLLAHIIIDTLILKTDLVKILKVPDKVQVPF